MGPRRRNRITVGWLLTGMMLISACGGDGDDGGNGGVPRMGDSLFNHQWHLKNTGQKGGKAGEDIRVAPVWSKYTGDGVRIAIVDLDLEIAHEDLAANVVSGASFSYLDGSNDPTGPTNTQGVLGHGTSAAGIAAAVGFNAIGVRGVAPEANLVGYNLLVDLTDSNEADAMVRGAPKVAVSNNSWGAADNRGTFDPSSFNWQTAINQGLTEGRNTRGTIYLWAAGNGGSTVDNSNYDGRANYRGVLAVGAVNDRGVKSSYSEEGANVLVSAPSGEFCNTHTITTVDRTGPDGSNNAGINGVFTDYANDSYTRCFNGTSAATPVVSGVVALMLQANPKLSWRDVRLILAQTARKNNPNDSDWTVNGAGFHVNHKYGFGVVNAQSAVAAAESWTNVGQSVQADLASNPNLLIPDASTDGAGNDQPGDPVSDTIAVTDTRLDKTEFVDVILTSDHTYAGDLEIVLRSPSGTISHLSDTHVCKNPNTGQQINCGSAFSTGWRFGSVRHIGESAVGDWTLTVQDGFPVDAGTFQSWRLIVHGR